MFGTSGDMGRFGELTGFPKTGTTMSWLNKHGTLIQRGDYQGLKAKAVEAAYRSYGPWQYASDGWYLYAWPSYWRYWRQ